MYDMLNINDNILNIRRICRNLLSTIPNIYIPVAKLLGRVGVINNNTEIVIEGYPRCANSFAESAFLIAQNRDICIAHHSHSAAQVIAGVRRNIPVIVLFRHPDDAVISRIIKNPWLSPRAAYHEYLLFYSKIEPIIDRCVLSSFKSTTEKFGEVLKVANRKYKTKFNYFDHNDPYMVKKVFKIVDELAKERIDKKVSYSKSLKKSYHNKRDIEKKRLKYEILKNNPKYRIEACNQYNLILKISEQQFDRFIYG